jgi:hypothetical protein
MEAKQWTFDEADKYIKETINHWISSGNEGKVISLAKMISRWRRSKTISPLTKMKEAEKNIKALNLIINRNQKINAINDSSIQEALNNALKEYAKYVAEYNESKTKEKLDEDSGHDGIFDPLP